MFDNLPIIYKVKGGWLLSFRELEGMRHVGSTSYMSRELKMFGIVYVPNK